MAVYCILDPGATQLGEIDAVYFRTVDVFAPAICPSSRNALRTYQKAAEIDPANTALAAKIADAKSRGN